MNNPFVDVSEDAYYYQAVLWAVGEGITNGTDDHHFSPNLTANRAQCVTFLYRYVGAPAVENKTTFADVPATAYYADAVGVGCGRGRYERHEQHDLQPADELHTCAYGALPV